MQPATVRRPPAHQLPELALGGPLLAALAAICCLALALLAAHRLVQVDRGIRLTGTIAAGEAPAPVVHDTGGTIVRLHVREGANVAAGDLVASLATSDHDAQIAALQDRATEARGRLAALHAEARALIGGADAGHGGSEAHTADLEAQVRALQHSVAGLEARVSLAEQQLGETRLYAPRAGRVTIVTDVAPGDVVAPGAILAEIAPLDGPVVVEGRIASVLTGDVRAGQPAKVWLTGLHRRDATPLDARIAAVATDGVEDGRVGLRFHRVRIEITAGRADLARRSVLTPGQRVEVLVPTGAGSLVSHVLAASVRSIDPAIRGWLRELDAS